MVHGSNSYLVVIPTSTSLIRHYCQYACLPVWGLIAVLEKPANVRFCEPSNMTLHAGILVRAIKPPAAPINLAAVGAPNTQTEQ